jgi:hypothetical protein
VTRLAVEEDLYARLGVSPSASTNEIATAFRACAKTSHPDLHPGDAAVVEQFKALTRAYDVLTSPSQRADYDRHRAAAQQVRPRATTAPPRAGGHQPIFRTARSARAAAWLGVALFTLGTAGSVLLASVPTGDAPKTITLWLVVAKLLICGVILVVMGKVRLWKLAAEAGASRGRSTGATGQ